MSTAYLVMSHHDLPQVERLVHALVSRSAQAHVCVAHDDRRYPAPDIRHPRVQVWRHGLKTDWGSWELVQVTLDGLRRLRDWAHPSMVALASGQDYICGDLSAWESSFIAGGGGWVGSAYPLHYEPRWGKRRGQGDDNWNRYHFRWFDIPRFVPNLAGGRGKKFEARLRDAVMLRMEPMMGYRVMRRADRRVVGIRTQVPTAGGRPVYKGQQMLAMDARMLDHLLATCAQNSPLVRHYRHTVIPDESLIQTVLSWEQAPREDLSLTYIGWDTTSDGARYLDIADLPDLLSSDAVLCRKVCSRTGGDLCDALDALYGAAS
ncbi:hypothetical protein [Ornithinimicrobium tianjinense]|uniref:Core-2/I-Branching enzyme n=1 Tax=Ornithinimicrobium tianjinense TaxID=1195761 RepID=A0A917F6B6_9MICO|nr:hypothetical protein [Ornithinimicrobium tianjinense]GGF53638.1 hypothetical protein GCM10011366_21840 [Ornithinimicrobium tianjinense]